jgi:hypothetical protein
VVSSVSDRDPGALRELERLGLMPGVGVRVEQSNAAASLAVTIGVRREPVRVGNDLAACVLVAAAKNMPRMNIDKHR